MPLDCYPKFTMNLKFPKVFFVVCCLCITSLCFVKVGKYRLPLNEGHFNRFFEQFPTKIPIEFDISQVCDKICNRDQTTCFDPIKTLLVYKNNTRPKNMTFSQSFQSHIWKVAKEDIGKSLTNDSYFKRVHCTVDELDTAYDTMDMKPKCAIIGNSGILLNSRCGREIDSHDYVIRANLPGLKEYNRDVGNKTTLMMMNRAAVGSMCKTLLGKQSTTQAKENYRKMLEYFRYMNDSILWMAKGTGSFRKHLQRIAVLFGKENIHTRFGFSYVSTVGLTRTRWRTRKVPSSGLIMLAIAETFCQNMTLYGFYPYAKDPSGNPVLYHYYQPNLTDFHTNAHDFDKEHKMLRSLQDQGFLRLVIDPCGK